MDNLSRKLSIEADERPVTGFSHAYLSGREAVGPEPLPFTLRLWNLSDSDYNLLASAKQVSVCHEDSILASGQISDVCKGTVPEGTITEVVFSPGLALWEAPVSLSVEAGVSVSETIRQILEASGTGITLLSFPGEDPVRTRGQAFFGRAAECVNEALSAAGARCCLTPSGLCVIPKEGLPLSMELSAEDLADIPVRTGDRNFGVRRNVGDSPSVPDGHGTERAVPSFPSFLVVKTKPTGWPLGKMIAVNWEGQRWEGLVIMRSVNADNQEGSWEAELLVEISP